MQQTPSKNTSIIKDRNGESQYRITTIVMKEKLTKQADDSIPMQGVFEVKNKQWQIKYNYGEDKENIVDNVENKTTIEGKVINDITVKDPQDNKENITLEQLAKRMKAKPKKKEIKIVQRARELRSTKRQRSPNSEKDKGKKNSKKEKPSHHTLKSRQDGLAGDVKPTTDNTPTPQDAGTAEPSPGTSGTRREEPVREKSVEKYRAAEKTMVLGPDGKFIPRVILKKDDGDRKEEGKTSDPHKYKYVL